MRGHLDASSEEAKTWTGVAVAGSDPRPIRQFASDLVSLWFSVFFTALIVFAYKYNYAYKNRQEQEARDADDDPPSTSWKSWKPLYALIALTAFFGSWSSSLLSLDAYNVALGLDQSATYSGLLTSVESLGALPALFLTYFFLRADLQREWQCTVRGVFLFSLLVRVLAWLGVAWGLATVSAGVAAAEGGAGGPGASSAENGVEGAVAPELVEAASAQSSLVLQQHQPDEGQPDFVSTTSVQLLAAASDHESSDTSATAAESTSFFLLFSRFLGGLSRGINTQVSAPLVKYIVPQQEVGFYAPFLGLIVIVGNMSAAVFSATEISLVHFLTGSGFAHEGTALMAIFVWVGLFLLVYQHMPPFTFADAVKGAAQKTHQPPQHQDQDPAAEDAQVPLLQEELQRREQSLPELPEDLIDDAPASPSLHRSRSFRVRPGEGNTNAVNYTSHSNSHNVSHLLHTTTSNDKYRCQLFFGTLSICFLRTVLLTGVEDALALMLQTRLSWPNERIGFVSFLPVSGGILAFLATPSLKRLLSSSRPAATDTSDTTPSLYSVNTNVAVAPAVPRRTPAIRVFFVAGVIGVGVILWLAAGETLSQMSQDDDHVDVAPPQVELLPPFLLIMGNMLIYLSVFGAERESLGILFERMRNTDANWASLALSVCQQSGAFLGPPLARTIVGGSGGGSGGDEDGDTDTGLQTYGLVQLALIITMQVCYEACLTWVDQVELRT